MLRLRTIVVALAALAAAFPASAVNLAFMPGDAFFHAELTAKSLKRFGGSGIGLEYAYPPDTFAFCGYAGFTKMKIVGETRALSSHVKSFFKARYKQQAGKEYVGAMGPEEDFAGFRLFVYDRSFAYTPGSRIGLKYNENWARLQKEATDSPKRKRGMGRTEELRFTTFVPTVDAVAHEWQHATEVSGLPTRVPAGAGWGTSGPRIKEPAQIDAAKVQLVVVPEHNLAVLFERTPGTEFFAITIDGIVRWHWDERRDHQSEPWSTATQLRR